MFQAAFVSFWTTAVGNQQWATRMQNARRCEQVGQRRAFKTRCELRRRMCLENCRGKRAENSELHPHVFCKHTGQPKTHPASKPASQPAEQATPQPPTKQITAPRNRMNKRCCVVLCGLQRGTPRRSLSELQVNKIDFSGRARPILKHRRWEPAIGNVHAKGAKFRTSWAAAFSKRNADCAEE